MTEFKPLDGFTPQSAAAVMSELSFNDDGLVPVIAQDATNGEVLMLAWMNAEAVEKTLESGWVTYWSRSRKEFWRKGETSGHIQKLVELRIDCDGDTVLVTVDQTGPACHMGPRSCFFRSAQNDSLTNLSK